MATFDVVDAARVAASARTGEFLRAEIISPVGGRLRVTYNWQYSALNCDPNDSSQFPWMFSKLAGGQIAISPALFPDGRRQLFASVRDDNSWYLQCQAPFSANWVDTAQRDEQLSVVAQDLLFVTIRGFNGQLIGLENMVTSDAAHTGYRLRSAASVVTRSTLWFVTPAPAEPEMVLRSEGSTTTDDDLARAAARYPTG